MLYSNSDFLSGLGDDILPYLIYADYLDEIGRSDEAESLRLLDYDPVIVAGEILGSRFGIGFGFGYGYGSHNNCHGYGKSQIRRGAGSWYYHDDISIYYGAGTGYRVYGRGIGYNIGVTK